MCLIKAPHSRLFSDSFELSRWSFRRRGAAHTKPRFGRRFGPGGFILPIAAHEGELGGCRGGPLRGPSQRC